ncbi:Serine protease inhibitor [Tessaracoccus bendigoensis DSM 12906]|uniref:Serine protease inhibitor n=1 Tax=Tessaracoccus bendigoensis DSM 12906 TaxID=1123357 RepID=A0A1M6JUH8_9ACTN|nr:serpin family protein [Tessaracoccus bendigoensis]SHJ50348.1 Serine protease inhibitor [Tessaracoccus bendigoensis DSM 12906]
MIDEDRDVAEALKKVAPQMVVPRGLVAGARKRRSRSRAVAGSVAGVGAMAVAVGFALPAMVSAIGPLFAGQSSSQQAASQADERDGSAAGGANPALVAQGTETAAAASEALGWAAIQGAGPGNQVVSPSSLALSLAMAAEGAEGASEASIDEALGLVGDARSGAYSDLRRSLTGYETSPDRIDLVDPPVTPALHLANRLVTIDREAEAPFVERLARWFDVPVVATTQGEAKAVLDAWVNENSGGLIEESAIEVVPELKVVTQDALLFSAAWATPFERDDLALDFDGVGKVDALQGIVPARYAEGDRWTAIRLPYDDRLAADVILPKPGVAPTALTEAELAEAGAALATAPVEQVDTTMPVLDLRSKMDLLKALPQIDLNDLGGIFDGAFAGQWWQQSVLQVSAKGTVGAAVTEMGVYESAVLAERSFVADRGYVFRVVDTSTSWPLFLASVVDPSAAG